MMIIYNLKGIKPIITNKGVNRKKGDIRNIRHILIHKGIITHMHNSIILLYYRNDQLENIIYIKNTLSTRVTKTVNYLVIKLTRIIHG